MKNKMTKSVVVFAAAILIAATMTANARRGDGPVIYVTSQNLFFDSILAAEKLPPKGPFQLLEQGGPSPDGLQTQFGPGDRGYRGGRWWVDVNANQEMDDEDSFFSCPLLGPGRESP
ncbi:MAG: hypothetical protein ACYSR5_12545 [Planctomycetota bacterium]|jgi:hypothetical protein